MKNIHTSLSFCLISLFIASVQAAQLNVTDEMLYLNSTVTLEYPSSQTQTFSSAYLGSVFSGDHSVDAYLDDHYLPSGGSPGYYDHVWIEMNADFAVNEGLSETTYLMEVETDVYSVDSVQNPDPSKRLSSVSDYESLIEISMDFFVSDGNAEIFFDLFNEGTYAPTELILDDLTTSTRVIDFASELATDPNSAYTSLLDGHSYSLSLRFSEKNHDDDDARARLVFADADLVRATVAEPAILFLLSAGLAGLGVARKAGRRT